MGINEKRLDMGEHVRRGYVPSDSKEFNETALQVLRSAGEDLYYLLNRNYKIKGASTLIGNHYMLSERQRLALVRAISLQADLEIRKMKECQSPIEEVNIDGFNTIITLEVALSGSLLVKGMDGTIRDLAGLRGTYRLIDKTRIAIQYLLETLEEKGIKKAHIFLDAPVSNSGRLKQLILEMSEAYPLEVRVEVINEVDAVLSGLKGVVSSDAIILNKCESWINLNVTIIEEKIPSSWCIDFCN